MYMDLQSDLPVMDEGTYSTMSGGKLTVSAICAGGLNDENSYANCEVEILVPKIE